LDFVEFKVVDMTNIEKVLNIEVPVDLKLGGWYILIDVVLAH